ncbi:MULTISPECIES: pathogenicity island protein [Staphylococcus]|uniref:Pathogenicity island protein n=1 Tax=Staphylococcus epidermidis TaxID=1282 RepID=A0A894TPF6_STAEP|nr:MULTISPECIES: pathogenicity island protein [Staphylococcus]KAB2253523.1 pathogenicity island protein [Staphylococcus epidermidis]MBE9440386.1 pathogenicity island protein [Staphylococcus epidermidis]MBM5861377.1 pathogenicity island protein [Staphylococcus epidermidis]QQE95824.1 pathogenicity island protein [Staphylococcus epidermidis]QRS44825.1 pathogenicity island protein [Staphylococcus epidermidis]
MNNKQELNTTNNFREENEQMNKLTREDYKNMEKKIRNDKIFEDKKHTNKISKLLQKRHDREASIIKKQYPQLSNKEIDRILVDYREYQNLISATETLMDFPINYEDANVRQFITKDDIEDLKVAIGEMTSFIGNMEDAE